MIFDRDKIVGCIFGLALGDALGRNTEFMSLKEIRKAYGPPGLLELPTPALFTDDTQMTIAVARALADARHPSRSELVRTLTNRFTHWKNHDEPRAPGVSCMTSIKNLQLTRKHKKSWTLAPVLSKGCGANMRVAPTALLPNTEQALGVSQLQAAVTHAHPLALAATELTAMAIRLSAHGVSPEKLPSELFAHAMARRSSYESYWLGQLSRRWSGSRVISMHEAWTQMAEIVLNVVSVLERNVVPKDVCAVLGASWTADEAFATSLFHAIHYAGDPLLAISMAARTSGDSDSIACITGAILGAYFGEDVWPYRWVKRIERRDDLNEVIDTIDNFYHTGVWH
jgi:ADP-ribosylglycohydrolase